MAHKTESAAENGAYLAFVKRAIKAAGERVGDGDIDSLPVLLELRELLDRQIGQAVVSLRSEPHLYSAQQIASQLGVTRQAVMQRWPLPDNTRARKAGGQPSALR